MMVVVGVPNGRFRGGLGGNVFHGNTQYGLLVTQHVGTIYAMFNTWDNDPPSFGPPAPADIHISHEGVEVIFE